MQRTRSWWWMGGWLLVGWWLAGCATTPPGQKDLLEFLQPGKTPREEVLLRLGQPSGTYEGDRILTYRIGQSWQRGYFIIPIRLPDSAYHEERFNLVVVFDGEGRLTKHRLVRVH